jgi:hypothetical protein
MNTIYFDPDFTDDVRRQQIYEGQVIVYSPRPGSTALCEFAREMISQAFKGMDPQTAQNKMAVEEYASILSQLKPDFIHHPDSKELLRKLLCEIGCDREQTYFDVPRMRSSTSDGYLTTGIAYAWHPHRDTWYSAPSCQINYWIPVYEIKSDNAMAFHPRYWSQPVSNDSSGYNYAEWNNRYRFTAAQFIKEDPRPLPRATKPVEIDPQIRLICPPGGIIMFSAAQLHSSVPNTSGLTRFSIDFRTVHLEDVKGFRGAPNIDSESTGTTMNDYLRVSDLSHIDEEFVSAYNTLPKASSI